MKKQLTLKELSEQVNIAVGTIRAWTLKPINGVAYNSKNINYDALHKGLNKYFSDEDFENTFKFAIEDIEIIKSERNTKEYLTVQDLIQAKDIKVVIHNYALKTEAIYKQSVLLDNNIMLFIFDTERGFKAYTTNELEKDNIKIEQVD